MIFKKTLLALSLSAVSAFATAAPAAPTAAAAPAAAAPVNVLQGAPAYTLTSNSVYGFTAYTPLSDDDHVQRGGIPQGAWTSHTMQGQIYVIDFSGAPCVDKFGSCDAKPGKGAAEVNTVVIYSEQPIGAEVNPTDTTLLGAEETANFSLSGYDGNEPGVTMLNALNYDLNAPLTPRPRNPDWKFLKSVEHNDRVKKVITFPTQKLSKLRLVVNHNTFNSKYWSPTIVGMEAFNIPSAAVKP